MTRLLLILGLWVFGCLGISQAATINAASTSRTDVGTAVTASSDGDTVVIPAGTSTWTTGLTLTKAITLQGAGIGLTIIRDGIASGYLINTTLVSNQVTRITGIEFNDNGAAADWRFRFSGTSTDDRRIRVDNCKFDSLSGPVFLFYTTLGVIDHNIIIGKSSGVPAFMGHSINSSWGFGVDVGAWGDGSFTNALGFGTEKFLFFEDNAITNLYAASALTMLDGHSGTRYVVRNNIIHKGSFEIHGPEASRTRGGAVFEIYTNTMASDGSRSSPIYMRGGVGRIHGNTFVGWTTSAAFSLLDNRLITALFAPFGGADGRNPWDLNNSGNPFVTGTATGGGESSLTDSSKSWTTSEHVGRTVRKTGGTTSKSVSSLTRSGDTCTVTATGHGFSTGWLVTIYGANQYAFNGIKTITVTDANTFTFPMNALTPAETTATGTMFATHFQNFGYIIANTATTLTLAGTLYGSTYNPVIASGDTYEIVKVDQSMDQIGTFGGTSLNGVNVPSVWSNTQTVNPWYEWNNTREGGANVNFSVSFSGGSYHTIVSGTHFFNDTAAPGYVAYPYPHPLVSGEPPLPPSDGSTLTVTGNATATQLILQGN